MSYGLKISKEHFDVKTADILDLVLSSENNAFKIKEIHNYTHSWIKYNDTTWYAVYDYYHGLGFVPYVVVWKENIYKSPNEFYKEEMSYGDEWYNAGYYVDSTKVRIRDYWQNLDGNPPPFNTKGKILICYESLKE